MNDTKRNTYETNNWQTKIILSKYWICFICIFFGIIHFSLNSLVSFLFFNFHIDIFSFCIIFGQFLPSFFCSKFAEHTPIQLLPLHQLSFSYSFISYSLFQYHFHYSFRALPLTLTLSLLSFLIFIFSTIFSRMFFFLRCSYGFTSTPNKSRCPPKFNHYKYWEHSLRLFNDWVTNKRNWKNIPQI